MIIAGLWLDKEAPAMEVFLKPFIEELQTLYRIGMEINSKMFRIICVAGCADSCARCKLSNMMQFNGKFGCTYCTHPGALVKVSGKKQLRYVTSICGETRSVKNTLLQMKDAEILGKSIYGVKGVSPLVAIPNFNIISGLPVDIMHSVFLGVVKSLAELWFNTKNHTKSYYIGRQINKIDDILLKFHPYKEISR